jgi:hypothetical protein
MGGPSNVNGLGERVGRRVGLAGGGVGDRRRSDLDDGRRRYGDGERRRGAGERESTRLRLSLYGDLERERYRRGGVRERERDRYRRGEGER